MPQTPTKRVRRMTLHEWVIGEESTPTTAKDFAFGVSSAEKDMRALGVDMAFDDCYHVRAGDGGEIVLYVELDEEDE